MSIVSVGGIAGDVIVRTPRFAADGECVTATELYRGVGGKAANQAVAAARLGSRVALVGCVGDDEEGRSALARLSREGIATEAVVRTPSASTGGVVLHRLPGGEKRVAVFPGANARLRSEAIDAAASILADAALVLVQLEIPLDAVVHLIERVRASRARLILDASPVRKLPHELLDGAIVKANAAEAAALTGTVVRDLPSARAAAEWLLEKGAAMVALEAGREGNLFATRDEEAFVPRFDVSPVDETGAGDALVGALAVALLEERPLREAARFASAAAALTTRQLGAQSAMPSRAELDEWLAAEGPLT